MTDEGTVTSGPTADELAAHNAELRAQLQAENDKLQAQLAESQAATAAASGHTDEDVRRLEHPEEFADTAASAAADQAEPGDEARSAAPLAAASGTGAESHSSAAAPATVEPPPVTGPNPLEPGGVPDAGPPAAEHVDGPQLGDPASAADRQQAQTLLDELERHAARVRAFLFGARP